MSRWVSSNALIDIGCRDRRGQPSPGLAATAHIPALRALPSLRDPGTQRAQCGFPALRRRTVRGGCGVLRPRTASDSARRRHGRHHGQGPTPSIARLRRTGRRQSRLLRMAAPTVIGLQARQARAIEFVLKLLRDGYVGEVLSTTTVGLSVAGNVGGPAQRLHARQDKRGQPAHHHRRDRGADRETAADQIAIIGILTSGASASIQVREGVAGGLRSSKE
jgi:hypothetical protein